VYLFDRLVLVSGYEGIQQQQSAAASSDTVTGDWKRVFSKLV